MSNITLAYTKNLTGPTRHGVGIQDADFAFETVGVREEETQDLTEVGDEAVGRACLNQPVARRLERFQALGLQADVVDAAAAEHRHLMVSLVIAFDLEQVDLDTGANAHEGQAAARDAVDLTIDLGAEDVAVEADESVGVLGEDRDVVEAVQEHAASLPW